MQETFPTTWVRPSPAASSHVSQVGLPLVNTLRPSECVSTDRSTRERLCSTGPPCWHYLTSKLPPDEQDLSSPSQGTSPTPQHFRRKPTESCGRLWNMMKSNGKSWKVMGSNGTLGWISWNFGMNLIELWDKTPWNFGTNLTRFSMDLEEMSWNFGMNPERNPMEPHRSPWNPMELHETSRTFYDILKWKSI